MTFQIALGTLGVIFIAAILVAVFDVIIGLMLPPK